MRTARPASDGWNAAAMDCIEPSRLFLDQPDTSVAVQKTELACPAIRPVRWRGCYAWFILFVPTSVVGPHLRLPSASGNVM